MEQHSLFLKKSLIIYQAINNRAVYYEGLMALYNIDKTRLITITL